MCSKVIAAHPMMDYRVLLEFEDGTVRLLDVKPWMDGEWYTHLKDIRYFNQVRPHSLSGAIMWPEGQDIAPEDILEFGKRIYDLEARSETEARCAV